VLNQITIDPNRRLGDIDRTLFGGFVEHLGRCVYGGIHEPGSALADEFGLRSDVRAAIERLRLSTVRYPGGNFVSGYRWRDGVGPAAERPVRMDLAWGSVEPNTFGTNEFIRFCRTIGVEPYLVVNAGDGDLREARDWVEYCNGSPATELGRLRGVHGYPEPHGVRYWGVGNEVDGLWQIGAKTASEYARTYREFAKAMRATDPSIRLVASATSDWEIDVVERAQALVEEAGDLIDYMSIHWYVGNPSGDPDAYLATSELIEDRLRAYEGLMRGLTLGSTGRRLERNGSRIPVPLAVDEWNVWYRTMGDRMGTPPHLLEEVYDLADALVVAMHLNAFIRHAGTVRMANLAQLVNVIAPIVTTPEGLVLQTIFHPFELFSRTTGSVAIDAWWDGDTFDGGRYIAVRTLDVSASLEPSTGRLAVNVINRGAEPAETSIRFGGGWTGGPIEISTVSGSGLAAENSHARPDAVATTNRRVDASPSPAGVFSFEFEPWSLTVLILSL
jgi:alpha-L-arabinofuranosidase